MEQWKRTVYVCLFGAFMASIGLSQAAPLIPLFLHDLGVHDTGTLARWSGLAMGATYLIVALVAPFWGRLADKKGRKITLLRASLGMTITNLMMYFAQSPEAVIAIRILNGFVSGFYSGSITLVATETPQEKTGWALGILSSANLAGSLIGPMVGGYIGDLFGIRNSFLITTVLLATTFVFTYFFVHEDFKESMKPTKLTFKELKTKLPHFEPLLIICIVSFVYAISFMAIPPILSIFVKELVPPSTEGIALLAGTVFSITGFAQMMSSSYLGRLVDKFGARKILILSFISVGAFTICQAYVQNVWQLSFLRFLLGMGLGGLMPAINTYISNHTPKEYSGQVFGYNISTQFMGYFIGAVGGANIVAYISFTAMFWVTGLMLALSGVFVAYRLKVE